MIKIACYGVRPNEVSYFQNLNKYNYTLNLVQDLLTHDNIETARGMDGVLLRGNCVGDAQNLAKLHEYGIKYVFTRTVGYNHIDLKEAERYGMIVARVPAYSPNSVAELSLTLAMMLLRHTAYTTLRTSQKNFIVDEEMFSPEIRNCTVGILGMGRIGLTEAKLFKGLGARILGYDVYISDQAREVAEFVEMKDLLAQSDIVSLHLPYFVGKNEAMVNDEFLSHMKKGAILINTARGELQDNQAILRALKSKHLAGFATDVLPCESKIFFKKFPQEQTLPDPTVEELIQMYPRVLITPHMGSNTDEALKNMIEISYDNFHEILTTGQTQNIVKE